TAPVYKPAPSYKPEPKLPPQPFAYQYGVKDDYTGAAFNKNEEQDSYGNLQGSYTVNLPDGRFRP
ncbi:Cuticle protein 19, partial [Caligus rogercresseyi]